MLWAVAIFLITFSLSLALCVVIIIVLPPRYFAAEDGRFLDGQSPLVRWLAIAGKNLLGLTIIAAGVLLSLPGIPGQGVFTILIGVMLLDFPGKHQLVRRAVQRPGVLRRLNRLRSWFSRPPLEAD